MIYKGMILAAVALLLATLAPCSGTNLGQELAAAVGLRGGKHVAATFVEKAVEEGVRLHSSRALLEGNVVPLAELSSFIDELLAVSFQMLITTSEGTFTFFMEKGEEFTYSVLSTNRYLVSFTSGDEVSDMLASLFDSDEILEVVVA